MHTNFSYLGKEALTEELCVVMVRTVRTPREMRPATAPTVNQKDNHDTMTMRVEGMYIWIR